MNTKTLESIKNSNTYTEIFAQPDLWLEVYALIQNQKQQLQDFLRPILAQKNLRIILTGAGSSAFIGEAAQGIIQQQTGILTQAIATTDLVTHPQNALLKHTPTLAVSFARSGNSPESVEAIRLLDAHCDTINHILITCNKDGEVAEHGRKNKHSYSLILPERSNDKGLAMTGSFTSMLLSSLLIFDLERLSSKAKDINTIAKEASGLLDAAADLQKIASLNFSRAIFLGSGPALGIARECHLKLQELTDGHIICKHDSFLGFRHGPRVVADEEALLIYLTADDERTKLYENDLIKSIAKDARHIPAICVGCNSHGDLKNTIASFGKALPDTNGLYILPYTLIGQLLGFFKSLDIGLNPDNPSVSGAISRVVEGVIIYE